MALSPGTRLGDYEVVSLVGAGGMGEVYRARDTRLGREAALKVLPDAALLDAERRERFDREARAVAALNHPNIVTIYAVIDIGSTSCLAMELVDGRPLSASIPVGGMPAARLMPLAIQLADAVSAAHQQGVVHRDLKPANVMVTGDGRVKVLDFGLARLKEQGSGSAPTMLPAGPSTGAGRVLGTVAYMSPEQAEGKAVDHRSDIFSLGIVLYEMATGQAPFKGDSSLAILSAIVKDTPPSITEVNAALPRELGRMIRRCLAKDPEQRYQSAKDLRNDLEELKRDIESGEIAVANTVSQLRPGAGVAANRRWLALGVVMLGVVVVTAAVALLRPRGPARPTVAEPSAAAPTTTPTGRPRVAVALFENQTGDPSLNPIGAMAQDYLTAGLSEISTIDTSASITPLGGRTPAVNAASIDPVRSLAQQTGAGVIVTGAYYLAGDTLQMQARIVDARSGKLLNVIDGVSGPRSDATTALQTLRQRVMGAIAQRTGLADRGADPLYAGKPPLYDAYREFLAGYELFGRDYAEAIRHFERAATLDPGFFLPQFEIAVSYGNQGENEKAGVVIERLYRNRDRLGAYERLYVDWYRAALEGRATDALARLRDLERIAPGDLIVKYLIGLKTYAMNKPVESIEALKMPLAAVRSLAKAGSAKNPLGDNVTWAVSVAAAAHHMLGRYVEELQVIRDARNGFPHVRDLRVGEARALAALGRTEELERLIAETIELPGTGRTPGEVMAEAVAELRVHGRPEAALAVAQRAAAWQRGTAAQMARTEPERFALACALYRAERWQEARVLFKELAVARPQNLDYQLYVALTAARLGDRTEATRISQALDRVDRKYLVGGPTYYRSRIAAVLGDREEAVALLRRALAEGAECGVDVHHEMDLESLRDYPPFQELLRPKG